MAMFRVYREQEQNRNMFHVPNHVLEHDFLEHMFRHIRQRMFLLLDHRKYTTSDRKNCNKDSYMDGYFSYACTDLELIDVDVLYDRLEKFTFN